MAEKRLSRRERLTSGANPTVLATEARDARDNTEELQRQALGKNKELYDFISKSLEERFARIEKESVSYFDRLSDKIYNSIVDILQGKINSGDLAEALGESLSSESSDGLEEELKYLKSKKSEIFKLLAQGDAAAEASSAKSGKANAEQTKKRDNELKQFNKRLLDEDKSFQDILGKRKSGGASGFSLGGTTIIFIPLLDSITGGSTGGKAGGKSPTSSMLNLATGSASKTAHITDKGVQQGVGSVANVARTAVGKTMNAMLGKLSSGILSMSKSFSRLHGKSAKDRKAANARLEKTLKRFQSLANRAAGGSFKKMLGRVTTVYRKFGLRGVFTMIGRRLKRLAMKLILDRLGDRAMSKIKKLKRPLNLKLPKFKFKSKYGSPEVKRQSDEVIHGMYAKAIGIKKDSTEEGYSWIGNIMNTVCGGMTKMLSSISMRVGAIAVNGIAGIFKALLNPMFLIPVTAVTMYIFRDQIYEWVTNITAGSFTGIFRSLADIGNDFIDLFKTVGPIVTVMGKWLWRQTNPKAKWSIAWFLDSSAGWLFTTVYSWYWSIKKWVLKLAPGKSGGAFLLGMALGGYPWPLYGAMIYQAVKWLVKKMLYAYKKKVRTLLGIYLCWMPNFLFRKLLKVLGLSDVEPIWADITKSSPKTLEDVLAKQGEVNDMVNKLTVSLAADQNINPALAEVGIPNLKVFNSQVERRIKKSNSEVEKYNSFLSDAAGILTDSTKAPGLSPDFYNSPQLAQALLSVFFFQDPLTGQIMSMIPKANIADVVKSIQDMVIEAVGKNSADALADVNRSVLSYFDYMNRGRSTVVGNITNSYQQYLLKMGKAQGAEQQRLAQELASGIKDKTFATDALSHFISDLRVKADETSSAEQIQIRNEGTISGLDATATGVNKIAQASAKDAMAAIDLSRRTGDASRKLGAFTFTPAELGKKAKGTRPTADKAKAWESYQMKRDALKKQGLDDEAIAKAGYGMDYKEWSEKYDKANPPGSSRRGPAQVKPAKVVLPRLQFSHPSKLTKIRLPGITRDITSGTMEFKLYSSALKSVFKERTSKNANIAKAWEQYQMKRSALVARGKTPEELKEMGYDMSYSEWLKKFTDEQEQQKELDKLVAAKETDLEHATEKDEAELDSGIPGPNSSPEEVAKASQPMSEDHIPNEYIPLVKQINGLYSAVKNAFVGFDTLSLIPELAIVKNSKGKTELDGDEKTKERWSFRGVFNKLRDGFDKVKDTIVGVSDRIDEEKDNRLKYIADMMGEGPEDMVFRQSPSDTAALYDGAGVALVSDTQWVSAKEAHELENRIFRNAQSVREIIEGLNVMGGNLDSAKTDLSRNIENLKRHPNTRSVSLPPVVVPGGLQVVVPDERPEYDPLPAL